MKIITLHPKANVPQGVPFEQLEIGHYIQVQIHISGRTVTLKGQITETWLDQEPKATLALDHTSMAKVQTAHFTISKSHTLDINYITPSSLN